MSILYTVFIEEEDGIHNFSKMFMDESFFDEFILSLPYPVHSWECHGKFEMSERGHWIQVVE